MKNFCKQKGHYKKAVSLDAFLFQPISNKLQAVDLGTNIGIDFINLYDIFKNYF